MSSQRPDSLHHLVFGVFLLIGGCGAPGSAARPTPGPSPAAAGFAPVRVNLGGEAYRDSRGDLWAADRGCEGGWKSRTEAPILRTPDAPLYQTFRVGLTDCRFPVPDGAYTVTLGFVEPAHTAAGRRKFDVELQDLPVLQGFDIAAEAGKDTAVERVFAVTVADGELRVGFVRALDNPLLAALEIAPEMRPSRPR